MKKYKIVILILTYLFCITSNANAYLDPGTGSIILQAILAFIAGAAVTVSLWWMNFKIFIKKIFRLDKKKINEDTKEDKK
tara:strand:+ start:427 stop:666 length:240 start_codon:yes stop_codon:yes gene_type:complete